MTTFLKNRRFIPITKGVNYRIPKVEETVGSGLPISSIVSQQEGSQLQYYRCSGRSPVIHTEIIQTMLYCKEVQYMGNVK